MSDVDKNKRPFDFLGAAIRVKASEITTFGGGGDAWAIKPRLEEELALALTKCGERGIKPYILGGGSNTIVGDGEAVLPVIDMSGLNGIEFFGDKVYAMGGARLGEILRLARERGLGGLEFMSGVPASLGGALKMNASAFGRSMSDILHSVVVLTLDGGKPEKRVLNASDIDFGYRRGVGEIVLGATLALDKIDRQDSVALSLEYISRRVKKQPRERSCGSVFLNGDYAAGKLIEGAGLKGAKKGGAQISPAHANFIVNNGGATASDFMYLVKLAEDVVYDKFGIKLKREFEFLEGAYK